MTWTNEKEKKPATRFSMLAVLLINIVGFSLLGWAVFDQKTYLDQINTTPFIFGKIIEQKNLDTFPVTITTYHAAREETDSTPCRTADNTDICNRPTDAPAVCAVSPDLASRFPFGTKIELSTLGGFWSGECVVHDRTNARLKNTIDLLVPDNERGGLFKGRVGKK